MILKPIAKAPKKNPNPTPTILKYITYDCLSNCHASPKRLPIGANPFGLFTTGADAEFTTSMFFKEALTDFERVAVFFSVFFSFSAINVV